jgi:hypothetical protein
MRAKNCIDQERVMNNMSQVELPPNPVIANSHLDQPVTIAQLPMSTMNIKRVSLKESSMMNPDSFQDKKVIGQGTFG